MTEKTKLREQASRSDHLAAIGELAAGVAHEINNPIGMMLLDLVQQYVERFRDAPVFTVAYCSDPTIDPGILLEYPGGCIG